jgi:hypothetical protein
VLLVLLLLLRTCIESSRSMLRNAAWLHPCPSGCSCQGVACNPRVAQLAYMFDAGSRMMLS